MSSPTLADCLVALVSAFPRTQVNDATLRLYAAHLDDVPPDLLADVTQRIIRLDDWFPTVRRIREVAAEQWCRLPSEDDALAQVDARIAWGASDKSQPCPPINSVVKWALDSVGGWTAVRGDNGGIARAQFVKAYTRMRKAQIEGYQTGRFNAQLSPPTDPVS